VFGEGELGVAVEVAVKVLEAGRQVLAHGGRHAAMLELARATSEGFAEAPS
jgi:hypothetical protein